MVFVFQADNIVFVKFSKRQLQDDNIVMVSQDLVKILLIDQDNLSRIIDQGSVIQLDQGYVVVVGHNNDGEKILVIWRDVEEHDNKALEKFFRTIDLPVQKNKLDLIYINGDDNLPTIRQEGEGWKVKLIEKEFHKRMFEKKGL